MSNGYQKYIVKGNLTRDTDLRHTASGQAVCNISIAINEAYKDKESTLFLDVVAWGQLGENAAKYLSKGSPVLIEGKLQERSWESDGQTRKKIELVAQIISYLPKATSNNGTPPEEISDIEPF